MDITLHKIGEQEPIKLPYNIFLIKVNKEYVFVRKTFGRLMPLSKDEQENLKNEHNIAVS